MKVLLTMKEWTPGDWGLFFGFLSTFITVTLVPSIMLILSRINKSDKTSLDDRNRLWAAHDSNTRSLIEIAKSMPATPTPTLPVVIIPPPASGNSGTPTVIPGTNTAPPSHQGPPGA